jgi:hypothetical protein
MMQCGVSAERFDRLTPLNRAVTSRSSWTCPERAAAASAPPLGRFPQEEFAVPALIIVLVAVIILGLLVVTSTGKIVQEYERGVIFRLGHNS